MLRFGTFQLRLSWLGVIPMAVPLLILMVGAAEALARTPAVQDQLPLPALAHHYELGPKLFLADRLYAAGPVDCIFIGSSVIGRGVIPEDFSAAYQAQTGRPLTCFNFGLDTLTFSGARNLTEILVRRYHPKVILFGVYFLDFTTSDANKFDLDTDWARAQLGAPDVEGWLESNLISYRYALTAAQTPKDYEETRILSAVLSPFGYYASDAVVDEHKLRPVDDPGFFTMLDTLNLSAHRPALDALLATDTGSTQLVMVDMPMSAMTARALIHFGYDYKGYLNMIYQDAQAHQVVFIPTPPTDLIPDDGFQDEVHMNTTGASLFSTWLGGEVAGLAQQSVIRDLAH